MNKQITIDAIFVLAGGIKQNGECYDFVKDRLNLAAYYYKKHNIPIFCIGGGSYHTPTILNSSQKIIHESTSCAEYLLSLNIPKKMIYKEWAGYDTIANGFFSFVNFINPLQFKKILLITSLFHLPRAKIIFNWCKKMFNSNVIIEYISSSNESINEKILKSRINREKNSILNLENNLIKTIDTIPKFYKWFYSEHKAYSADSLLKWKQCINDDSYKSY